MSSRDANVPWVRVLHADLLAAELVPVGDGTHRVSLPKRVALEMGR
jgi:hypothetical protein